MVKGVNKTVIEVRDTGNRMFEKIVFYVAPEYGKLSAKALQKAASEISFGKETYPESRGSLRKSRIRKRRIFIASVVGVFLLLGLLIAVIIRM